MPPVLLAWNPTGGWYDALVAFLWVGGGIIVIVGAVLVYRSLVSSAYEDATYKGPPDDEDDGGICQH